MEFRTRTCCPCCNNPLEINQKTIKGGINSKTNKEILQKVWMGIGKTDHFDYLKCQSCNSLYNKIYPSDILIDKLYSSMPPNMEEAVDSDNQIKNQLEYAKIIYKNSKFIDSKIGYSFLELGADRGLLVKELCNVIGKKFKKCVGIEPNDLVKEELIINLENSSENRKIFKDIHDMGNEDNQSYNLAACIHILDHCFNPQDILLQIQNRLVINGILLVVVHNPDSSLAKLLGKKWPPYCSQHPQLFTKKGMNKISELTGFKLIKKGRTFNNFKLAMITKFLGFNFEIAENINLKLPLGNMYYILKKCN